MTKWLVQTGVRAKYLRAHPLSGLFTVFFPSEQDATIFKMRWG
jgi:hypothetical protein